MKVVSIYFKYNNSKESFNQQKYTFKNIKWIKINLCSNLESLYWTGILSIFFRILEQISFVLRNPVTPVSGFFFAISIRTKLSKRGFHLSYCWPNAFKIGSESPNTQSFVKIQKMLFLLYSESNPKYNSWKLNLFIFIKIIHKC